MDRSETGASEEELREWLAAYYARSLTSAAAAILASTGTMRGGAAALHRAGFSVPPGYLTEAEEAELGRDEEAALRRWIIRAARARDFLPEHR